VSLVLAAGTLIAIGPAQAAPRVAGVREFDEPSGLAFGGGNLWVTNEAGNSVTEINPSSDAWVASFTRAEGYLFSRPVAITRSGANLFVANAGGSVSEMSASNGKLVRVIEGAKYRFVNPVSITSSGDTILVLNAGHGAGSITELSSRTGAFGALVRVVSGEGLDAPDGIAVQSGNVWVADNASSAATEINATTGVAVSTFADSAAAYGFWHPTAVIGAQGNVYVMTPLGTSPMVTKVSATSGTPAWYMCNTNGPYYFSLLSAFAVSGDNLWVASRSGANSQTPGAATGSLTEMSITSGALITTLPAPSSSTSTTTTTTSSTTTTLP
jgi:hypothetical protein